MQFNTAAKCWVIKKKKTHLNVSEFLIRSLTGAKVTTSCAKAHIERCQSLGADSVIDSDDSKALETVRDLDVGFDPVGSDVALWAVKKGGVCVSAATHTPTALSVLFYCYILLFLFFSIFLKYYSYSMLF